MEIERLFGLPAHPLLLHIPIVLVPMIAAVGIALAIKPAWRERWGLWFTVATVGMFVVIFFVAESGEALAKFVPPGNPKIEEHVELADQFKMLYFVLMLVVFAQFAVDKVARRGEQSAIVKPAAMVLSTLVVLGSVASVVWDIRTGHAGASAKWDNALTCKYNGTKKCQNQ